MVSSSELFAMAAPPPPPANDDCSAATVLTLPTGVTTTCVSATTTDATQFFVDAAYASGACSAFSGADVWFEFTTPATLSCWDFRITRGASPAPSVMEMISFLPTGCASYTIASSALSTTTCADATQSISTNSYAMGVNQPNTTYKFLIFNDLSGGQFNVCMNVNPNPPASNDECTTPMAVGPVAQSTNNNPNCLYSEGATDPPPGHFCAVSLENTAWYSFTTSAGCAFPCSVVLSLTSISCVGGGSGFQIGYFSGACGSLTSLTCASGSGTSVITTLTNLNPNQTVTVGIDGNGGANCSYNIAASNTVPIPLPLNLFAFSIFNTNANVELNWVINSKQNKAKYLIERSSNSNKFEQIGEVDKEIITVSLESVFYKFIDKKPLIGDNYYRIATINEDGDKKYSEIKHIYFVDKSIQGFKIVPVPSNGEIEISFDNFLDVNYGMFDVYSMQTQQKVFSEKIVTALGKNNLKINLNNLDKGVYFTTLTIGAQTIRDKIILN